MIFGWNYSIIRSLCFIEFLILLLRQHLNSNDPTSSPDIPSTNSESAVVSSSPSTPTTPSSLSGRLQDLVWQLINTKRNKLNRDSNETSEVSNDNENRRHSVTSASSIEDRLQTENNDANISDNSEAIPSPSALLSKYRNRLTADENLTPLDLYKRNKLRQRNKIAATKCRIKRKAQHQLLFLVRKIIKFFCESTYYHFIKCNVTYSYYHFDIYFYFRNIMY